MLDWVKSTCNTTSISSSASSTSLATSVNGVNNRANQGVHDASSSLNLRGTTYSKHITYGCTDLVSPSDFLNEVGIF
ncbi:unnamed protein product [Trichobilharzia regenti]|nr:unnamed protein product [Trichobilharzia regenti]